MAWLDLTFKEPASTVTREAHDLGLETQIVDKVPAWKMVVMRVSGEAAALTLFLEGRFEPHAVAMHVTAMKHTPTPILAKLKDRKLRENRS